MTEPLYHDSSDSRGLAEAQPDQALPDWPLLDLLRAAEAHWGDAARLGLLLGDLAARPEPEARELYGRLARRLRELPLEPRARVVRHDPAAIRRTVPPPIEPPTPEMAAILRLLELERTSNAIARQEAASLRRHLAQMRAVRGDEENSALRRQLYAAREDARAARAEALRLAERLAFATSAPGHARQDAARQPPSTPERAPSPDPAYAELGLSPDLPDDLVSVYERALLRHHHPDRAAPEEREIATKTFQKVTIAFQRIRTLRGL
jgi:hypothetical protein